MSSDLARRQKGVPFPYWLAKIIDGYTFLLPGQLARVHGFEGAERFRQEQHHADHVP
jgi:hypothetical protein